MTVVPDKSRKTWSVAKPLMWALGSFAVLFIGLGIWSVSVQISGAVIGVGKIEVSTSMTAVQHPIGGVVAEINARNGDTVKAGDLVVRLDSRQMLSDLNVVEGELFEVLVNIARLEALIDGRKKMELHPLVLASLDGKPQLQALMERQKRQLQAKFETMDAEGALLDEQISQINAQIEGNEAQLQAKKDERELLAEELEKANGLAERKLIKLSELFDLQKDDVTVRGEIGHQIAKIAELRGKVSELNLKRLAIAPTANEKAVEALSKLRPLRTRHYEKRLSILDGLTKLDIRAPINGRIHDSKVLGKRSVIVAAKPLMMIVPDDDPVLVGVKVSTSDIDQVYVGQKASLKFKSFSGRETPIILGEVSRISADAFSDPVTKKFFYEVKVKLIDDEMAKLGDKDLLPGMPVDAFLSTESRTPINYVLHPIKNYFDKAFRDT